MISVIIPLYNKAHTIVNTLNSVFNQTYQNFEVIIVDDGSTDNGIKIILQNYTDERIRIISQKNAGVSAARNKGIDEAKGEWIAFLDADDEWLPNYLEEVKKATEIFHKNAIIIAGRYSQNYLTKQRKNNIPTQYINKTIEINFFENPHVFFHISSTIGKPLTIYNGCIENQATSILKKHQIINDNILFNNTVINEFNTINLKNKTFKIFMKYTFRHTLLQYLKKKDYENIHYILNKLNDAAKLLLIYQWESFLYTSKHVNKLAIYYILFTKIIWRIHNYPRIK